MKNRFLDCQFAVVGAGPYGLAVASHLRAAGLDVRIFGKTMDFWDSHMPKGMWLRSPWGGSNIADPERALTLDAYAGAQTGKIARPLPLEDFVRYGQWFQRRALPDMDPRLVVRVERAEGGFDLALEDGDSLTAQAVIIATGIGSFPNRPAPFASLPPELASHTSERINRDLGRFAGQRVLVVGGGQSAIESAALLSEGGAEVEVLIRQPQLRWLNTHSFLEWLMDRRAYPFKAPGRIGPVGVNWLIENPRLFTMMPRAMQARVAARAIRPAASSWLRPRTQGVTIRTGQQVVSAAARAGKVHLHTQDGQVHVADHVLMGTGYKVDVSRLSLLAPELLDGVRTVNGYPILNAGLESTVPGLYFVGKTASYSFGPVCSFVVGTQFTAGTLTRFALRNPAPRRRALVAGI